MLVPFHLTPSVISSVCTHLVGRAHITRLEGPQPGSVSCPQSHLKELVVNSRTGELSIVAIWAEGHGIQRLPKAAFGDPDSGGGFK